MANVKTFNLTIYFGDTDYTWRGISRVAVKRYIAYYQKDMYYTGHYAEER